MDGKDGRAIGGVSSNDGGDESFLGRPGGMKRTKRMGAQFEAYREMTTDCKGVCGRDLEV